ncbi:hypothetical protein OIO90_001501 [Microbotryomycetes sp. JL221]|nr:hypothetical protein OIO90_001501 [Microbotryomycetes sp. JL221]
MSSAPVTTQATADSLFQDFVDNHVLSLLELSVRLGFSATTQTDFNTSCLELVFVFDPASLTSRMNEPLDPRQVFKLTSIELTTLKDLMAMLGLPPAMPVNVFQQRILLNKYPTKTPTSSTLSINRQTFHVVLFAIAQPQQSHSTQSFSLTKFVNLDLSIPLDDDKVLPSTLRQVCQHNHDDDNDTNDAINANPSSSTTTTDVDWKHVVVQAWYEPWYEAGTSLDKLGQDGTISRDVGFKAVAELAELRLMERQALDHPLRTDEIAPFGNRAQMTPEDRQQLDQQVANSVTRNFLRKAEQHAR